MRLCTSHHRLSAAGDKQLLETANSCVPRVDKCVVLILDEIHIKEDWVFDKHTCMLYFIFVLCTIVQFWAIFFALGILNTAAGEANTTSQVTRDSKAAKGDAGERSCSTNQQPLGLGNCVCEKEEWVNKVLCRLLQGELCHKKRCIPTAACG